MSKQVIWSFYNDVGQWEYLYSRATPNGDFFYENAVKNNEPKIVKGTWPCWTGKAWKQVEDHRKRESQPDLIARYGDNFPQDGTEYWLPGDTYDTPPRMMKEVGPLPEGALLERPAEPEPTSFEKIAEVQAPFLEQQSLAKSDFITARIEGDMELEAKAQKEYQASVEAMKQATAEVVGE